MVYWQFETRLQKFGLWTSSLDGSWQATPSITTFLSATSITLLGFIKLNYFNQSLLTLLILPNNYTNLFGKNKNCFILENEKLSSPNLWILKNPWLRLLKAVSSTLPLVSGKRSGSSLIRTVKWQRWYVSQLTVSSYLILCKKWYICFFWTV